MKNRVLIGMLVCGLAASGVSSAEPKTRPATAKEIALIRSSFDNKLKDADSAKFKDVLVYVKPGPEPVHSLCGQVNSKNSYGAYAGYSPFFGVLVPMKPESETIVLIMSMDEVAAAMCEKERTGTAVS